MLRISNLIRSRTIISKIGARAGYPGWDRPDPPPTVKNPVDHYLTEQEIIFHFRDSTMSEYVISQPEVYEGDTVMEALPTFLKYLAGGITIVSLLSAYFYLIQPRKIYQMPTLEKVRIIQNARDNRDSAERKQWIKDNPIGIKPIENKIYNEFQGQHILDNYAKGQKILGEVKTYLLKVKQNAVKKVEKDLSAPQIDHSSSDSHHKDHHDKAESNSKAHQEQAHHKDHHDKVESHSQAQQEQAHHKDHHDKAESHSKAHQEQAHH